MAVNPELAEQLCEFLNDVLTMDSDNLLASLCWGSKIEDLPKTMSGDEMERTLRGGLMGVVDRLSGCEKGERQPVIADFREDGTLEGFHLELGQPRGG
jgi:hypothetical protein